MPYERVPDAVACGDVFVTASVSETYPLVVMEAAAAGMPALGVRSPGVGEIIEHDVTGLLVGEDETELADAMLRLASDARLRERLSSGAREHSGRFDIRCRADELLGIYERLIAEKRAS
jgi:glycosyltransferase involved in cell wall biosynthesis